MNAASQLPYSANIRTLGNKIKYLKMAANLIADSSNEYNWLDTKHCNCGWLVRVIDVNLDNDFESERFYSTYEHEIHVCEVSGKPFNRVIQTLINAGFTTDEITLIESGARSRQKAVYHLLNIAFTMQRQLNQLLSKQLITSNQQKPTQSAQPVSVQLH